MLSKPLFASMSLPYLKAMGGFLFAGNAKLVGMDTSLSQSGQGPLQLPVWISCPFNSYTPTPLSCFFVHALLSLWNEWPPALRPSAPLCPAVSSPSPKARFNVNSPL